MMTKIESFRLPLNLYRKLESVAKKMERKKSDILRIALERYLEDIEDYNLVVERLSLKDIKFIPHDEVKKIMGV